MLFCLQCCEEGCDPGGLRGGGATDEEAVAYFFDGESGVVVELEVSWLLRVADPEVDVGFVPYFEAPLGYFFDAVAVDEVLGEGGDHGVPERVVLGGETFCLYQKACSAAGSEAIFFGMKLSSTKGRM